MTSQVGRISDIIKVAPMTAAIEAKLVSNSKFRQSGLIGVDPRLTAKAQKAGLDVTLREWARPSGGEATSMGDDPAVLLETNKVNMTSAIARVISRARAFSNMDISDFASESDALAYAASEFGRLRLEDEESTVLAMLAGLLADNAANDAADMAVSATLITTGTIAAANSFNAALAIKARASMGDRGGDLKTLAAHSDVINNLRALEPNSFVPASKTDIGLEKYLGYNVVETDNLTKGGTTNYPIYTSYLAGDDVFAYAACPVDLAFENDRNMYAGGGSGQSTIMNRFRYLLQPVGFSNIVAPVNGVSQANSELDDAATWDRKVARKAVPLVAIKSNA